jgi:uncharacterized protein
MSTALTASDWIPVMVERIVRDFDPVRIVLFGSRARGVGREDSDVDLLVVLPRLAPQRNAVADVLRALADVPVPKDIVVTTPQEIERRGDLVGTVLRPALREGKVLYERG